MTSPASPVNSLVGAADGAAAGAGALTGEAMGSVLRVATGGGAGTYKASGAAPTGERALMLTRLVYPGMPRPTGADRRPGRRAFDE